MEDMRGTEIRTVFGFGLVSAGASMLMAGSYLKMRVLWWRSVPSVDLLST
jgi:hypothetical protein